MRPLPQRPAAVTRLLAGALLAAVALHGAAAAFAQVVGEGTVAGAVAAPLATAPVSGGFAVDEVLAAAAALEGQRLLASCERRLTPVAAVIAAGVTAEGLEPEVVQGQLERQLTAIEAEVETHGGSLRRHQRLRGVRDRAEPGNAPFVVLQTVEIELPVAAPIDTVLGRLLVLGVDRFGGELTVDRRDTRASLVARYHFADLLADLTQLRARCREQAIASWCATRPDPPPGGSPERCAQLLAAMGPRFRDESFSVSGLHVVTADGSSRGPNWLWPPPPELANAGVVGAEPVDVTGSLAMTFRLR
jgi:hypothetical protein